MRSGADIERKICRHYVTLVSSISGNLMLPTRAPVDILGAT